MQKKKKKKRYSKTKYYILAALSYLLNAFATGLVITETGKNQLKKYSYLFVSKDFLPVYTFIAAVLMIVFYYKKYISRHHFHRKTKYQAWACVLIHIIHPFFFTFWQNSVLFTLFLLFMIFTDSLFQTLNPARSSGTIIGGYIATIIKFSLLACCILCTVFFASFLFGVGVTSTSIMIIHCIIFGIYTLLFFEYTTTY